MKLSAAIGLVFPQASDYYGDVAQLVERYPEEVGVDGSSPFITTQLKQTDAGYYKL